MKDLLIDYSNNHEDISQPLIFWPSVMILLLSVVGIMWSLETPFAFSDVSPILNWGTLFLMVMTVYCFLISFVLAIGLIPFFISTIMLFLWLENLDYSIMLAQLMLRACNSVEELVLVLDQYDLPLVVLREPELIMMAHSALVTLEILTLCFMLEKTVVITSELMI